MNAAVNRSLSYNATYLGTDSYGLLVLSSGRWGLSDPDIDFQPYGARDGGVTQGATVGAKYWTDHCLVEGDSRNDLYSKLDNIKFVFDPHNGAKALIYDGDVNLSPANDRQWTAVLLQLPTPTFLNAWTAEFDINWIAPSGHAESTSAETVTPTINETPETFYIPTSASEVVGGNITVRPVYLIRNTTGGNITSFALTNSTTSETINWSGVLATNHYIRIDANRQHVERSADGVTYTTAISGTTAGNTFPRLAPRVRNTYVLTGFTAATMTITYTEEFL